MGACRPLKENEFQTLLKSFGGKFARRNRALIWLGICTGFRINELLSLRVEDVYEHERVLEEVTRPRRFMKGKKRGRTKKIYPEAREAIKTWIVELRDKYNGTKKSYLFTSNKGGRLTRVQAYRIIKKAARESKISTKRLGTHTLRKTFADRMYDYYYELSENGAKIDVMRSVQLELDHEDIGTTYKYMEFKMDDNKPDNLFAKYNPESAEDDQDRAKTAP